MKALTILIHKDPITEETLIQREVSGILGLAHFIRVEITEIIPITGGIKLLGGSCNTDDKYSRHNNNHARTQQNIVKRNKSNKEVINPLTPSCPQNLTPLYTEVLLTYGFVKWTLPPSPFFSSQLVVESPLERDPGG
ncbi:hypothetical protein AVEN_163695-1 [Araneus ventricosus]|uniref:Uncharacterized protein n=1 Tax=Araneus ventricosus TaxID=182803 RepID=A0A4Y2VZ88_ARAVE|nr:hypothetical protein AVEN_163695-1 [Araneus ventricosus]